MVTSVVRAACFVDKPSGATFLPSRCIDWPIISLETLFALSRHPGDTSATGDEVPARRGRALEPRLALFWLFWVLCAFALAYRRFGPRGDDGAPAGYGALDDGAKARAAPV